MNPYSIPGIDRYLTVRNIETDIDAVLAKVFNTSTRELSTPCRRTGLVNIRFACMYVLQRYNKLTVTDIGYKFRRTHATVLHGLRKAEESQRGYNKELAAVIYKIKLELQNMGAI